MNVVQVAGSRWWLVFPRQDSIPSESRLLEEKSVSDCSACLVCHGEREVGKVKDRLLLFACIPRRSQADGRTDGTRAKKENESTNPVEGTYTERERERRKKNMETLTAIQGGRSLGAAETILSVNRSRHRQPCSFVFPLFLLAGCERRRSCDTHTETERSIHETRRNEAYVET